MNRIKQARKQRGITQNELAEKLGINRATLSKYENGQIDPTVSQIAKIADLLDAPLYELMGYSLKHNTVANRAGTESGFNATFGKDGAANESEWEEVPFDLAHADQQAHLENRMKQAFSSLNEVGQKVACERVEELSKIDDYKRSDAAGSESGISPSPDNKKPPEGAETPADGNK